MGTNNNYIQVLLVYLVCEIIINAEPKANRSIRRSYFLRLSLITGRVCCVVYKFVITHRHKIKHIAIVTSAVYSISMKSIFASTFIGSPGVVTHSIITTVVCCPGTLVYV